MRVGFYIGHITPAELGGGSTFQASIIESIKQIDTNHEIYFFYISAADVYHDFKNFKFVNLYKEQKCVYAPRPRKNLFQKLKKVLGFEHQITNILQSDSSSLTFDEIIKPYNLDLVYFYCLQYEKVSIPYIITVWDLAHRETPFFPEVSVTQWTFDKRENFYKEVLPQAARIITGNNEGKKQLCKYYNVNEDLVKTIPMLTPTDIYITKGDSKILNKLKLEANKYLYYPAQFWSHKNHIILLKELKTINESGYNFKLVFSGSDQGNLEYIQQKVKEFGLEDVAIFAGFLKREEVIALYENAYALTYASYFGPDNIPPLEAMALGCPVICSEYKGAHEQLKDCALFFNHVTGENFKDAIDKLKDDNFRNSMIEKGKQLANIYSSENYVSEMFKIIDDFQKYRECWGTEYKG